MSRELELDLHTVFGRFQRAKELSEKFGTSLQKKECAYQWAWTLYWWYDNKDGFHDKYCEYELMVIQNNTLSDLERLSYLWENLYTAFKGDVENVVLKKHTQTLHNLYEKYIDEISGSGSSLQARANYLFIRLFTGANLDVITDELMKILLRTKSLGEMEQT